MNEQLHMVTDDLNEAIKEFEDAILKQGLGVPATVPMLDGEKLTYGKLGNQWRLIFETESGESVPLLSASRGVRVQAVAYLPELLKALDAAYSRTLCEVINAAQSVRSLTRELKKDMKP